MVDPYILVVHPKDEERVRKAVHKFATDKAILVQTANTVKQGTIVFLNRTIAPLEPEEARYFDDFFKKAFVNYEPKQMNTILKPIFEKGKK